MGKLDEMKVLVHSKWQFDRLMKRHFITPSNVERRLNGCVISINGCETYTSGDKDLIPWFEENRDNVLVQFFDDITEVEKEAVKEEIKHNRLILFSESHAREIIEFIDRNKDKSLCIIHCAAGVARSGSVGEFINEYVNGSTLESQEEFKKDNPNTSPNEYVLKVLRDELKKQTINP